MRRFNRCVGFRKIQQLLFCLCHLVFSKDQMTEAKQELLNFSETNTPIKAPHFVMYVQQYLEDKYGEDYLKEKGLKVYTTLDWDLQEYAEETVKEADKT